MAPQLGERLLGRDLLRLHHQHALHDLGHVAQVERVVRLGGDRLEVAQHREEDVDGRVDDGLAEAHHVRVAVDREVAAEDR
eukprot:2049049-Prymnesium_polylepis.1